MGFQMGKFYQHAGGERMAIVGMVDTTMYGKTIVAECANSPNLKPVGSDDDAMTGWTEITKGKWLSCFTGDNDSHPKFSEAVLGLGIQMPSGHVYTNEPVSQAIRQIDASKRKVYGYFVDNKEPLEESFEMKPELISHEIIGWKLGHNFLTAEIKVLNTPQGKVLWEYMQECDVDFVCICKVESKPVGVLHQVTDMVILAVHAIPRMKHVSLANPV